MKLSEFVEKEYLPYARQTLKPKTVAEYNRLATGLGRLGGMDLARIKRRDVEAWILPQASRTPAQANRLLAVLSAVYRLAVRWERVASNPVAGVRRAPESSRDRYLDRAERDILKRAVWRLAPHEKAFVLVLMYTGARPGELQSEWFRPGMSEDCSTVDLKDSKTGRRTIYVPEEARTQMRLYAARFPSINTQTLTRRLRRLTGIPDLRLYDLRHTFASAALANGCTLEQIGQLLGHTQAQTTKRYAHLMPETGNNAAAKAAEVI